MNDFRQEGYELLQAGLEELAFVESNGIRIDVDRIHRYQDKLGKQIAELKEALARDPVWSHWRKRFGSKSNIGSLLQLGQVITKDLKLKIKDVTETGRPKMDEESLAKVDHPFLRTFSKLLKYKKAKDTFLKGIDKETVDGRLHPSFMLHTARSFRSSSSDPNFQNFPVRDKEIAAIIRKNFIPSQGCVLVENDFKGIEVALSAAYHKDPVFISYITTPGKDMHRDMAAQIYMTEPEEVTKDARYGAKNKFVFPQFYGDFYVSCAKALWEWMDKGKLTDSHGVPIRQRLEEQGIEELGACDPEERPVPGTFEHHLKQVEDDFWNRRFQHYGKWKKQWYAAYLEKGYFDLLTGFRIQGYFTRNQVTNLCVQGSAFHCLLWSLIKINRLLRKRGMQSKIVGQIHDSLIGDVPVEELREYLAIVEHVTLVGLPQHWKWLIVPPQIEYELCLPGKTWHDKQPFLFQDGRFLHPRDPKRSTRDAAKFLTALSKSHE